MLEDCVRACDRQGSPDGAKYSLEVYRHHKPRGGWTLWDVPGWEPVPSEPWRRLHGYPLPSRAKNVEDADEFAALVTAVTGFKCQVVPYYCPHCGSEKC
jgi:hypothetical protein